MKTCRLAILFITAIAMTASAAGAQQAGSRGGGAGGRRAILVSAGEGFKITESAPIEVTPVKNAPFSAQAVTEFTQTLGDGNRIERRYESSVARDSRGRSRREEEIALIGPLAAANAATPRLVTILDPDSGASYTLDDERRVAYRNGPAGKKKLVEIAKLETMLRHGETGAAGGGGRGTPADVDNAQIELSKANAAGDATVQDLGTRTIEGVRAQGTRTTTTIAAGAIGNLQPINIVSERWFSPELQMPVLVTRRDPRNGDTTYRLTHIQRGEQPDALFTVPSWYEVKEGDLKFRLVEKAKGKVIKLDESKR